MRRSPLGVITVCILILSVSLGGCEPLRKKFTRKKKEAKKEEFIPILEPIDYPPSRVSALDQYKYHYSLWQVWDKDLLQLIGEPTMEKRKNYLFTEVMQQLEEMKRWVPQEYLPKIEEAHQIYDGVRKELEKPEVMRNQSILQSRLRKAESFMMNELKPEDIFTEEKQ